MTREEANTFLKEKILKYEDLVKEKKEALLEYFISVQYLSEQHLNFEFNNKDEQHAAIVMSRIFEQGKHSLKFFCGSLKGDVCDHPAYIDSLKNALNRNVSVEIIFEVSPNRNSKCFKLLAEKRTEGKNITFHVLTDVYRKQIKAMGIPLHHFLIGDDNMIRYEFDTNEFKAYCNFDDLESVKSLLANYENLWTNSEVLN